MSEIKHYYPSDITSQKKAQEALDNSIIEITKIDNNITKFEYYESQVESSNTYHYVMQKLEQIKDHIKILTNYYQKTNKAFNNRPRKEINVGFISFDE